MRLGLVVERVPGGAHVGEFGISSFLDGDAARKERVFRRDRAERTVRMPELVAEIEQPAAVVSRQGLLVLSEIGHVVHQRVEPLFVRLRDIAAGRVLDFAEIASERDLLRVGDVLAVEHEDGVAVHPGLDRRDLVLRHRPPQIDPGHLADKRRMDLADRNGHRKHSVKRFL